MKKSVTLLIVLVVACIALVSMDANKSIALAQTNKSVVSLRLLDSSQAISFVDFSISVDGRANIFGAGKSTPPAPGGGGGGLLPPSVSFLANAFDELTLTAVTGTVSGWAQTCEFRDADGSSGCGGATNVASWGGVSGIEHDNKTMFLVGVFLDDRPPSVPAPPRLNATNGNSTLLISPVLGQTFFIGDGVTDSGTKQVVEIPENATRLFFGFAETFRFDSTTPGEPGWYDDNGGSLQAFYLSESIYIPVVIR